MSSIQSNTKILLTSCLIIDDNSLVKKDILISNRKIESISDTILKEDNFKITDCQNKFLSPGFIDMHVHLREPGQTKKETISTGSLAAAHGGFVKVAAMPNTKPVIDSPELIERVKNIARLDSYIEILLIAAITKNLDGKELTNFEELKEKGAIAFSDDGKGVQDKSLMKDAMIKAQYLNMPILAHAECENSLKTSSRLAEIKHIERDLKLAEETKCHYHICHVSTEESIKLIRDAKKSRINVTCEITPHHILLNENDIKNTNYKMNPPLRLPTDNKIIVDAICDGTIDIIATDHAPHTNDEKNLPYEDAPNGIVGLETVFSLFYTHFVRNNIISLRKLVELMSINPSSIFLKIDNEIKIGNDANFALIDLDENYKIDSKTFLSKGRNTPFNDFEVFGQNLITFYNGIKVWSHR